MASFFLELKRRNVFRVAAAYAIVSWLLIQIIVSIEEPLSLPSWSDTLVIVLLAAGFPVALLLAWAYDLTPDGIKLTKSVRSGQSVAKGAGRKLNYAIIGLLVMAVGYMFVDNYVRRPAAGIDVESGSRSIAVLPFENRSALEDDRFFVEGIHDELLTHLSQIGSLDKVISRTSVMEYRDATRNLREIGTALGVTTILEGGVQRAGDRVRVNVQLIDAATDDHLWANVYDRELSPENVFDIQTEVAMAIAEALQAALTPEEATRLSAVPTRNMQAYTFYQSGLNYFRDPRGAAARTAVQLFERAVEEDASFALAWEKLARSHITVHWFGLDRTESRRVTARDAIDRLRALAPDSPELHLATGQYLYMIDRNYDAALAEFALAERALPNSSEVVAFRAFIQRRVGQWEESVANMAQAIELDPRNLDLILNQAGTLTVLRDYEQGDVMADRALELAPDNGPAVVGKVSRALYRGDPLDEVRAMLDDPRLTRSRFQPYLRWQRAIMANDYEGARDLVEAWSNDAGFVTGLERVPLGALRGWTDYLAGDIDVATASFMDARAELRALPVEEQEGFRSLMALGEAAAMLGETDEAIRLGREALAAFPTSVDTYSAPELRIQASLRVFIPAGDYNAALDELEAYFAAPGRWSIEGLSRDPRLDPIRDDPRFVALVERYRRQ